MTMTLKRKMYISTRTTNFIFGPSPNSAWKWHKFVSHTGHSVARHLFVEMLQWPTRGQDVAAMHHSRLHLRGQLPCAPVAHREDARALSRTPQSPRYSPTPSRYNLLVVCHQPWLTSRAAVVIAASLPMALLYPCQHHHCLSMVAPCLADSFCGRLPRRATCPRRHCRRRQLLTRPRLLRPSRGEPWPPHGAHGPPSPPQPLLHHRRGHPPTGTSYSPPSSVRAEKEEGLRVRIRNNSGFQMRS